MSGKAFVVLDNTPPYPEAIYIGSVHTHNPGSTVLSGRREADNSLSGDQGVLESTRGYLSSIGKDPNLARLYVAANQLGGAGEPERYKIAIYNHANAERAIHDMTAEGPEADPDGEACPPV